MVPLGFRHLRGMIRLEAPPAPSEGGRVQRLVVLRVVRVVTLLRPRERSHVVSAGVGHDIFGYRHEQILRRGWEGRSG